MSTTTIRIEDELKARVAVAAKRAGKTAHAFILDAIAQTVEQVELDNAFNVIAGQRWANLQSTGRALPWEDAKVYLAGRARNEPARKPAAPKRTV